jgi:hypothetical protein
VARTIISESAPSSGFQSSTTPTVIDGSAVTRARKMVDTLPAANATMIPAEPLDVDQKPAQTPG